MLSPTGDKIENKQCVLLMKQWNPVMSNDYEQGYK
jgi:hypothetical protein